MLLAIGVVIGCTLSKGKPPARQISSAQLLAKNLGNRGFVDDPMDIACADVHELQHTFGAQASHDQPRWWVAAAAQLVPQLSELLRTPLGQPDQSTSPAAMRQRTLSEFASKSDAKRLQDLFNRHGSDKSTPRHNYHLVYAEILNRLGQDRPLRTLEIGLGTNNSNLASNMNYLGTRHRVGASLRSFRDFLPRSAVFGADVDERILFAEERIRTAAVDQMSRASFSKLFTAFGALPFDLIIDDGLHAVGSSMNTLLFALSAANVHSPRGAYIVVEDIHSRQLPVFELISWILGQRVAVHEGSAYRCVTESFAVKVSAQKGGLYIYVLHLKRVRKAAESK